MSIPPLLRGGYGSSKEEGEESQRPKFFNERKAQTKPGISSGTAEKVAVLFLKKKKIPKETDIFWNNKTVL